jgi:hypothetical protein
MYKNNGKYNTTLILSVLGLVFGIVPSLFWTLMLFVSIYDGEEIIVIVFSAIFLAIGVLFTVLGIKGLSTTSAVSFCCRFFDSDPDGIIEMDSILRKKGKGVGSAFEKTIVKAVEKDYFLKLTYDKTYRVFELSDRVRNMEEYRKRFIGRSCPNCGAPLKIKKGLSAKCDFCGMEVRADNSQGEM